MVSFTQYIQNPEIMSLQQAILQDPSILQKLIQTITCIPDPLLCNQRQSYLYPIKAAQILSLGTAYRLLVVKTSLSQQSPPVYPYLLKFFTSMIQIQSNSTIFGYCARILSSLVRKTPQIYEFIKDNPNNLIDLIGDEYKLLGIRDFLSLFLTQSTMNIYTFLKGMVIRSLIFKVVQQNTSSIIFQTISFLYQNITKTLKICIQQEKQQLQQVLSYFQDSNFITLFLLKFQPKTSKNNTYIANFLFNCSQRRSSSASLVVSHLDPLIDYFQLYQQTPAFMKELRREHLILLELFVYLSKQKYLDGDQSSQLLKRLLVYSNIHASNSFVHALLLQLLKFLLKSEHKQRLQKLNVMQFFLKSTTSQKYGFMSLRRKVLTQLLSNGWALQDQNLSQQQKVLLEQIKQKQRKLKQSKYYKKQSKEIEAQNNQIKQ